MPTPGNHRTVSDAPGVPIGVQTGHPASSSPPCNRTVPWSKHLFSPTKIPQLDGDRSFSLNKDWIFEHQSPVSNLAPLVQYNYKFTWSTPLALFSSLTPSDPLPLHNLWVENQLPPHPTWRAPTHTDPRPTTTCPLPNQFNPPWVPSPPWTIFWRRETQQLLEIPRPSAWETTVADVQSVNIRS